MPKPLVRLSSRLFPKDKLYPDTILFWCCFGFVFGALLSGVFGLASVIIAGIISLAFSIYFAVKRDIFRKVILIGLVSVFLGSSYFFIRLPDLADIGNDFMGTVSDRPVLSNGIVSFNTKSGEGSFRVTGRSSALINCGDTVFVSGIKKEANSSKKISFPKSIKVVKNGSCPLRDRLFLLKDAIIGSFLKTMPPAEAGLAAGIIFGDRSHIPESLNKASINTGTVHITALSGYNISVIISLFIPLSFFFPKKVKFFIVCLGIILFVLMVEGGSSVIRAALMGSLIFFAKGKGRRASIGNLIVFSAFVMTIFDPSVVVMDLGFELSFLALLGVVYLAPAVKRLFYGEDEKPGNIIGMAIDCFSAELCVLPLLLLKFGSGTIFSVLPNLLIIWTVPFAMLFSFLSGIIYLVCPPLGEIIGLFASAILSYEIKAIIAFDMFL